MTSARRFYEIACSFPALKDKEVEKGLIPGIGKTAFSDQALAHYLYKGRGRLLSHGESMIIEALLNLADPDRHDRFNLGNALQVLDEGNMQALVQAVVRTYTRK